MLRNSHHRLRPHLLPRTVWLLEVVASPGVFRPEATTSSSHSAKDQPPGHQPLNAGARSGPRTTSTEFPQFPQDIHVVGIVADPGAFMSPTHLVVTIEDDHTGRSHGVGRDSLRLVPVHQGRQVRTDSSWIRHVKAERLGHLNGFAKLVFRLEDQGHGHAALVPQPPRLVVGGPTNRRYTRATGRKLVCSILQGYQPVLAGQTPEVAHDLYDEEAIHRDVLESQALSICAEELELRIDVHATRFYRS